MKRKALATILLVLCLSLCVVFTSCSGGGNTDGDQGGSSQNKIESFMLIVFSVYAATIMIVSSRPIGFMTAPAERPSPT